jgi:hypothetical protein
MQGGSFMDDGHISISLKRFLLVGECPPAWQGLDLYLLRDEEVVFYVGQSHLAFGRVWEHLLGGFKGHSIPGRFVWCNWPVSMKFTVELLSSGAEQFAAVGNDVNAAERLLIERWSPCFNISLNNKPNPVPAGYFPPNARLRCSRSLRSLLYQAEHAVRAEDAELWMRELEEE